MICIPDGVRGVIEKLEKFGFEAYVVGGCVRDSIMEKNPSDWDVCTSALPSDVIEVFKGSVFPTGIKHGTVTVLSKGMATEVTTFRIDGEYTDGRHPDKVEFSTDIYCDLARRDFTVNSLAYCDKTGIIDPFDGINDIKCGILRCVGDPKMRFYEDGLRIMRALRFAAVCGFKIESKTSDAIHSMSDELQNIAFERIYAEIKKLICAKKLSNVLIEFRSVFEKIMPECFKLDVFDEKYCRICDELPANFPLRMAAICATSDESSTTVMHRLKADTKTRKSVCDTVGGLKTQAPKTKRDILMLMRKHGSCVAKNVAQINALYLKSDDWANSVLKIDEFTETECWSIKNLKVNGQDLLGIGISGRRIGNILEKMLDAVIDERCENSKASLLDFFDKNSCFFS